MPEKNNEHIQFTKMVASGNDFIVFDTTHYTLHSTHYAIARKICDRKFGIGADGLLLIEKSKVADIKMRIFNADGSEAEMCGNGARCAALFKSHTASHKSHVSIETKAGIIKAHVRGEEIKIKLTDPRKIKLDIPIIVNHRTLKVNSINTGVPHAVIFVEGVAKIDVANLGRSIRFHKQFLPAGTNVNFVEILQDGVLKVRTYERGVEDETLACGTGSAASALIFALKAKVDGKILVQTKSKEVLSVYFQKDKRMLKDVYLQGQAHFVAQGIFF